MLKMAYSIRTKNYLIQQTDHPNSDYIPQLYVKIKGWHPPPATLTIENKITDFEKRLRDKIRFKQKKEKQHLQFDTT